MIRYQCSDGTKVTQSQIDRRYSEALKIKHSGKNIALCQGCGDRAVHNDHTISRARCKHLHKTELIWDLGNFVNSCEKCHREWENWKSGMYLAHWNLGSRMMYLRVNDLESYKIRTNERL